MNLNAYDKVTENVDKQKTWYSPRYRRVYTREIDKYKYYNFFKRWNNDNKSYDYYLAVSDTLIATEFKIIGSDNYGRIRYNVPQDIIENSILNSFDCDTNIAIELVDSQADGKVYQLNI